MVETVLKYVFLAICIFAASLLPAQNYTLSNWTVEDGLSSNDIRDILQDQEGFIWIATEHGLNQFDGYRFRNFRFHPGDTTSIGANFINGICEDQQGNIWVNLAVGIVSKYNKRSKTFSTFSFPNRNTYAYQLKYIPGPGVCIATSHGLFRIVPQTQELVLLTPPAGENPLSVYRIFAVSDQQVYLGTNRGFQLLQLPSNQIEPVFFAGRKDTVLFDHFVEKCYEDSGGTIWIQTQYGSVCYSEDGSYFKKSLRGSGNDASRPFGQLFIHEEGNKKWLFSSDRELRLFDKNTFDWGPFASLPGKPAFAFSSPEAMLWVYTQQHDLWQWTGTNWEKIIELGKDLKYWEIVNVFVDDKNGIWLTTKGKGLWRISARKWPIYRLKIKDPDLPVDFGVSALFLENRHSMLLGTFNNLYRYHFKTENLIPLFPAKQAKNPLWNSRVNDIAKSNKGKLWIAANQSLVIIDKEGGSFRQLKSITQNHEEIPFGYIRNILSDTRDRIWIGSTKGLFLYEQNKDRFHHFKPTVTAKNGIRNNDIQCMLQVSDTTFLVGYVKEGVDLLTFHPATGSISCQKVVYHNTRKDRFDLMTANTFYYSDGQYWVGTFSRGLLRLDLRTMTMRPLSEGFPIIPNVKGILKGSDGNLWVSSIDGIRSVNPNDHTFYRFTKSSGLLSNRFYLNNAISDSLGNLYFGSAKGINQIQSSKWNAQDTISTPILTGFKKYDKSLAFQRPLNELKQIRLNHTDDFITFEFVSPTYDNPGDVQYAYQLQGFDKNWRYSKDQRSATYTNLEPGAYVFKVRAGNKGGFLNSEIKQLQVFVASPFWESGWFIVLIVSLCFFVLFSIFRIQANIRNQRLKIATEIRQKTAGDFHDELGHRLTKISLFVESLMLEKDHFPGHSVHILRKIQDNANELFHSTKDFIWAINPSKDSALDLFVLLKDFGDELFADTGIQFSVVGIREDYKNITLPMDRKRQLVLIFKEAMNNVLKHSDADTAILRVEECHKHMHITLEDNGKGFVLDHEQFGYGLGSMLNRSRKLGGQLNIDTQPEGGTVIRFKI